ncbi:MAG: hypothetical protein KDA20_10500, partial [Phycisphaerales bacterium]|nr:hypothetical protein [Phycisphaerales bacterium]
IDDAGNTELVMRMRPGSVIVSDGAGEEMRRTQLTIPVPPTARADEGDAQALNNLSTAIDQTQVFFTVTPKGDVQNVHGLERVMEAFGQLEQSDVRLLGPIAPGQIEQTLESIFGAEGAAGTSRRVGAGWQTTRTVDVPPVAVFDFTDDVMLDSINGPVATLVSKGTVGVRRPTVEDAARPALGVEAFSSTTTTQWNLEDGRLVARVSDMVMETRWQLAEVDLLQKQTVHVAIARPE